LKKATSKMEREISKLPKAPFLSEKAIKNLSELCFRSDSDLSGVSADTVFVFGTAVSFDKCAEAIINVIENVKPQKLIISGGMPSYTDSYKIAKPEAEVLYDHIVKFLPSNMEIHLDTLSNNCLENVQNSLSFLQGARHLAFVTKCFSAGRDYLTLKKFLPNVKYEQKTFDALYPHVSSYITRDNWYKNSDSMSRVWGEFLRIVHYGQRGDIAYKEVSSLVEKIMKEVE